MYIAIAYNNGLHNRALNEYFVFVFKQNNRVVEYIYIFIYLFIQGVYIDRLQNHIINYAVIAVCLNELNYYTYNSKRRTLN